MKKHSIGIIALFLSLLLSSCTYLKYASIQSEYARIQNSDPSQHNLKHMLERETFFVVGKTIDSSREYVDMPMVIAAYSDKFKRNERVDKMLLYGSGTHFGLNLPPGTFDLVVLADIDKDGYFTSREIIGNKRIDLNLEDNVQKIASKINIILNVTEKEFELEPIKVGQSLNIQRSFFYPSGALRSLEDPIFDTNVATLGMYDPASFLEYAPTMFYALEEDQSHKIPVVFVHGINDSPRRFKTIIANLDRDRYKPWFFYYPSGGDLDQLADLFYNIFISGKVILLDDMPLIVIAHSMGGLIVRESLNNYEGLDKENKLKLFVSIASPLGGHPEAKSGVERGLIVLPAWRDLDPSSQFIQNLYSIPLPKFVKHHLFYAYRNSDTLKLGENSDGVVPLSSQLHPSAQQQSSKQRGFKSGHADILNDPKMIEVLMDTMAKVEGLFPNEHMTMLKHAGMNLQLDESYDPRTKYLISYSGQYIAKLINGTISPFHPHQEIFLQVIKGKRKATNFIEKDFYRLVKEYPEIFNLENTNE